MTDPQVALFMLGILLLTIMLGFPIAFTLVAMGVGFGFYAYFNADLPWYQNNIFDLLVNQTYSVMINDVLVAVPLFLFMGYIVERANIVDRLFFSLNIAARVVPASMAVAALATCALFATAVGIIGAVVTLMGLLALPALLKAGYDRKFATGVICAGGCLGILIPPSIMLIVYAATTAISVVQAYAAAMFPGMMLAGLYMIYVVGRALLNPSLAPKPPKEQTDIPTRALLMMILTSFLPLALLIMSVLGAILFGFASPTEAAAVGAFGGLVLAAGYHIGAILSGKDTPDWVEKYGRAENGWLGAIAVGGLIVLVLYVSPYFLLRLMEDIDIIGATLPKNRALPGGPGVSIIISLAAAAGLRFFGGGSSMLAWLQPKTTAGRALMRSTGLGAVAGLALGALYLIVAYLLLEQKEITKYALEIGFFVGLLGGLGWRGLQKETLTESVYLTVRTSAMVCWLFVGSWTFSSVFSYLGGHEVIKEFVTGVDLSFGGLMNPTVTFLIIAQLIIFLLGWPLEWSEIIIIFVPIFLPLLEPFGIDPLFFGILVALNLQTSFMTPPMAMAAYYLKGVAPPEVQLMEIFKGCFPFLIVVLIAMVILYNFPAIALWLPEQIYAVR
ncbi:MAG: TRAP transporter large permease subunit [Acidiferrobacterales bacterium]